jgi:rhodanese-related sulfurtransferase
MRTRGAALIAWPSLLAPEGLPHRLNTEPGSSPPIPGPPFSVGDLLPHSIGLHIPLAELPRRLPGVPAGTPVVVYCAAGSRSSIAASLLRRSGHRDVSDLIGGEAAWRLSLTPAPGH